MYSADELLANLPDFDRTKIRAGNSPYSQPTMPGEQRLTPRMQEPRNEVPLRLGPSLKQASGSGLEFLEGYLPEIIAQLIESSRLG